MDTQLIEIPGRTVIWFETTASTMLEAARLARLGHAHGTIVGADEQTAGQGRLGREWHSARSSGLYVSLILELPERALPVMTLALGLAVAQAIERVAKLECDLRWPNDVLIGGRKVAGILTEMVGGTVIAGIGVNVNHFEFPARLAGSATSMRIAGGREYPRQTLLRELVEAVDRELAVLLEQGKPAMLARFAARSSWVSGKAVVVEQGAQPVEGVTDGLDADGFLWLRTKTGRVRIVSGGVRPAGE